MTTSHILGFPRIGAKRELKKAVEAYWKGDIDQATLLKSGDDIRQQNWQLQKDAGLDFISVGDFSWYDQVLDTSVLFGIVPKRFGEIKDHVDLDTYFCIARGKAPNRQPCKPSELTKWFDTNYHYIVPEFDHEQTFKISDESLFNSVEKAKQLGVAVKPTLLGPLSLLHCH